MDPMTMAMMAAGAIQSVSGIIGQGKAKKLGSEPRPEYQMGQGIIDNQALTESMAGQGLTDSSMQLYTQNAQRGLTRSIDAVLRGGGSANMIGDISQSYNDGLSNMSIANDQAQFRNINNYLNANTAMAAEQDKAWQINKFAPWADKQKLAAEMRANADKNVMGGVNTAMSAGAGFAQSKTNPTAGLPKSGKGTAFFGSPGASNPSNYLLGLKNTSLSALERIGMPLLEGI